MFSKRAVKDGASIVRYRAVKDGASIVRYRAAKGGASIVQYRAAKGGASIVQYRAAKDGASIVQYRAAKKRRSGHAIRAGTEKSPCERHRIAAHRGYGVGCFYGSKSRIKKQDQSEGPKRRIKIKKKDQ